MKKAVKKWDDTSFCIRSLAIVPGLNILFWVAIQLLKASPVAGIIFLGASGVLYSYLGVREMRIWAKEAETAI
ncbi:MAG: hypothetical protein PHS53_00805 [Candidatus Pacebacteria bacterium]|nr:hypothetical protein [Candidatus Paceibacterota bacterium]MDD5356676.1 hypothetical protein [Candidatus Paceibacterota bacterium]